MSPAAPTFRRARLRSPTKLISYTPGSIGLDPRASDSNAAFVVPDVTLTPACATMLVSCPFVSPAAGGRYCLAWSASCRSPDAAAD